jgi:predicted PurR-regulated permease PerM
LTDRIATFFEERTPRRGLALAAFIGLLVLFRNLSILLVFFVAFERLLGVTSAWVAKRFNWKRSRALGAELLLLASGLGGLAWWGAAGIVKEVRLARDTFPERLKHLQQNDLVAQAKEHLPDAGKLVDSAGHYAQNAIAVVDTVGHILAYALIGLILAVVYLLEEEEIDAWRKKMNQRSLFGTVVRWGEYLADAVSVTVQLQLIVAACNTVLTLPVLFILGIPDKAALMVLIFVSGLVPVIGNIVAGAVLSVMAYFAAGPIGVVVFVVLTFVLHKAEAYYLNPRLTARHVKLPGFLLIISLIAWEHRLGFPGLFVSFPFLFVAGKIKAEFDAEPNAA